MIITIYKDCGIINVFCHDDMIDVIKKQHALKRKYKVKKFWINNLNSEKFKTLNF